MFVEFENVFFSLGSIGGKWGQLGTNVLVEFKNVFLIGGLGANVLVEFEKKISLGAFVTIWGKCVGGI